MSKLGEVGRASTIPLVHPPTCCSLVDVGGLDLLVERLFRLERRLEQYLGEGVLVGEFRVASRALQLRHADLHAVHAVLHVDDRCAVLHVGERVLHARRRDLHARVIDRVLRHLERVCANRLLRGRARRDEGAEAVAVVVLAAAHKHHAV